MALSRELQDYYEACLDTLRSPGWKLIVEDFDRVRASVEDVRSCTNLDYAKGQLDILDMLVKWKETVEQAYDQLVAEAEQEA